MEIRYSCNQRDFKRYTTEETRKEFLIENLYAANEVVAVYSHVDRMVTLGCMCEGTRNIEVGTRNIKLTTLDKGRQRLILARRKRDK